MTVRRRRTRRALGQGPRKPAEERKDHLIQARVPRELDDTLKREAKRRRLSVSHLIRNVLEDTYKLVDGVISEVDNIVQDSVELSSRVRRDARELARAATVQRERGADEGSRAPGHGGRAGHTDAVSAQTAQPKSASAVSFEERTADIYAWNPVVLHRPMRCVRCERELERGATAHLGISQEPATPPRWLCSTCLAAL